MLPEIACVRQERAARDRTASAQLLRADILRRVLPKQPTQLELPLREAHMSRAEEAVSLKILRAARHASLWHANQRRKGASREPYVNHLIEVAELVSTAGASEDVICAAFLHDAIEDQGISAAAIGSLFGADVAALVCEVTDDKSLPKAERKAFQIKIAPKLSLGAKFIRLADKISNVRSVELSPPIDWSAERRRDYVEFCSKVVAGLRGTNAMLEGLFEEAARAAHEGLPSVSPIS
jgi:(p)ppGpp synthase/HD superfamily hydrolase